MQTDSRARYTHIARLRNSAGEADEGRTTVLLSTHDLSEARSLCDRVGILHEGRLLAVGTPADLIAKVKAAPCIRVCTARPFSPDALPNLTGAKARNDHWLLHSSNVSETVLALAEQLRAGRNELLDLQILRPTLEDAFLALTGKPWTEVDDRRA